jgi:hypothetical protein
MPEHQAHEEESSNVGGGGLVEERRKSITMEEVPSSWRFYNNKFELKLDLSLLQERKIITYNLLREAAIEAWHVKWASSCWLDGERCSLHSIQKISCMQ